MQWFIYVEVELGWNKLNRHFNIFCPCNNNDHNCVQVDMYNSLVSVMGEVVEDLETNYELHPRAQEWRAKLMERLLEYGDREDNNNNNGQSEINNNNNIPHPQQGEEHSKLNISNESQACQTIKLIFPSQLRVLLLRRRHRLLQLHQSQNFSDFREPRVNKVSRALYLYRTGPIKAL